MRYKNISRLILFSLSLLAVNPDSFGQSKVSQSQALQYYREAKAKGLSDAEIEKMALANGVSAEDLIVIKQGLADEIGDEVVEDHVRETVKQRQAAPSTAPRGYRPDGDPVDGRKFGANFFSSGEITFEPNLQIPTPINYIVGPGDEIIVDVSGNAVKNFKVVVSPEGTVNLANFPPMYVSGLRMEEAQNRIKSKLRSAYSGPGVYVDVTLGKIRSIRITVTGESKKPGTYTVPSLATAFHALYVSGGPNDRGTMRSIEVIRNNRPLKTIDFYKFLVNGDVGDNVMLEDQDIIFIRPAETLVSIEGEVKRPGVFELKESENLSDLLRFAGGFSSEAFSSILSYQRNTGFQYELGQVESDRFANFSLKAGDKFMVGKILDRFANRVTIKGAVFRPGDYPINEKIKTVSQLVKAAEGTLENAFLGRALLYRQNNLLDTEIITIDLRALLSGAQSDIELRRDDVLEIKTFQELRGENTVSILGEVIRPGDYLFKQRMTIGDLIFEAGGLTYGAVGRRIEIARRIKQDSSDLTADQNVQVFELEMDENLQFSSGDENFVLHPFDKVFIRKSPRYEIQKTFTVLGQVNYPGSYTVKRNVERISDAITRAGGLKETAYLSAAHFRRNGEWVALNLQSILRKPNQPSNLLLQEGDTLLIPEQQETVRISGAVLNPSLINYDQTYSTRDYLAQAGGFLTSADKRNIYVTHANGITDRTKKFLFFKNYPKVEPGSVLMVPRREEDSNKQAWSRGERVMLISSLTTVGVTLVRVLQEIWAK